MERYEISLTLADIPLNLGLLYPETVRYFRDWPLPARPGLPSVALTGAEVEAARRIYPPEIPDPALEFNELAGRVSDVLLPLGRCVFHGLAFLWRGRAFLFTAPSGTGKSTQYVLWKLLYGDEVRVLNGDKPILETRPGGVWVHPSPWNGKERIGCRESAPLGGVIYLEQGRENILTPLLPRAAAAPLFCQFLCSAAVPEQVTQVAALAEQVLQSVPVWRLVNRGDRESARLTHDALARL